MFLEISMEMKSIEPKLVIVVNIFSDYLVIC